jgi:hypothetical protein
MRSTLGAVLLLFMAACTTREQRMSKSIYLHEQEAAMLAARGDSEGAAKQQKAAESERDRLDKHQRYWREPGPF